MLSTDMQDLYSLLFAVVDRFNKAHESQVVSLDFFVDTSYDEEADDDEYAGSLVFPDRSLSVESVYYRDLVPDEKRPDWHSDEWEDYQLVQKLKRDHKRSLQLAHRLGLLEMRRNDFFF